MSRLPSLVRPGSHSSSVSERIPRLEGNNVGLLWTVGMRTRRGAPLPRQSSLHLRVLFMEGQLSSALGLLGRLRDAIVDRSIRHHAIPKHGTITAKATTHVAGYVALQEEKFDPLMPLSPRRGPPCWYKPRHSFCCSCASDREENRRENPSGMPIVARHDIVLCLRRIFCLG